MGKIIRRSIYAFIIRGLWKYMFLQQPFFFFDAERGYLLFALDYIAIMALFAIVAHYAVKVSFRLPLRKPCRSSEM